MRISINGNWAELTSRDLESALTELGYKDSVVATAVNGHFVAAGARASVKLNDNDAIEIVAPMQGG